MCGIVGSLGRTEILDRILTALRHRGPDAAQIEISGNLGVGGTRLRVNGGAKFDLPLVSRSGRTLLALNGEVFNCRDLYDVGPGESDLSGLADLVEREGPEAFSRIRGHFAAIVMDLRERTLLLARDEIGVRPLFFADGDGGVVAASEVTALREALSLDDLDRVSWEYAIAFQFWPKTRTPWRNLQSLEPGTYRLYREEPRGTSIATGRIRFKAAEVPLRDALFTAHRLQSRKADDVAITLSGGLDSSAVLALLCSLGAPPRLAACGYFEGVGPEFDERPHARAVARALGVELLEVPISAQDYALAWPKVMSSLGGPLAGPGSVSQWLVASALARVGARVVFSGQGGDELFGGYERHRLLLQSDLGRAISPSPGYSGFRPPPGTDLAEHLLFRGRDLMPFLDPRVARRVSGLLSEIPGPGTARADRVLEFEFGTFLPGLLAVDDRTLGAFGIEGRVPLLDQVVASSAKRVPLAEKSPEDDPRRLFKTALDSVLPLVARERRDKMGFPVPLQSWFLGPLRGFLAQLLALPHFGELGFKSGLDLAFLRGRFSPRTLFWLGSAALTLAQARTAEGQFRESLETRA